MNADAILTTIDKAAHLIYVRAEKPEDDKLAQDLLDVHQHLKAKLELHERAQELVDEVADPTGGCHDTKPAKRRR